MKNQTGNYHVQEFAKTKKNEAKELSYIEVDKEVNDEKDQEKIDLTQNTTEDQVKETKSYKW